MSVMLTAGELRLAQKDGAPPTALAVGSARGESGVSVLNVRFRGGAHVDVKAGRHLVCFVSQVHIQCRMAGRANAEHAPTGSLAICPRNAGALSLAEIASALNGRGVRPARGGKWHRSSVRNLLTRIE
jgi:hypothetical protein